MDKTQEEKKPVGRPSSYSEAYADMAFKLSLLGATDKQMADIFDVSESTFNLWKLNNKDFSESLKRGKLQADAMVANSLYNRALGYSHREDDIRVIQNQIVITETIKHYPPDTTACIYWLKNRQKENWRDKIEEDNKDISNVADALRAIADKLPD